ncbi:PIR Superfamily Protein [Plasmodium ovale wallikeri]|uniref:PIR Superfamily Protein n=1 Tax=Plasmodium ovale wallikeri TaxID=864142 RepID=A0A1A9AQA7_PLAOA|nr:PIR Superfamily Protein [Plasmodium ovale wallikeri]SBT58877.1 PIR Superfamily Protein [Plasmodium ovale wallikeri]
MTLLFEEFPLEKLYNEFNVEIDSSKHYSHCDSVSSHKWQYTDIEDFCKKLERNLEKISKNELEHKLIQNPCLYLNHWFSNEVLKISSSNIESYDELFSILRLPWSNINHSLNNNNNICVFPIKIRFHNEAKIKELIELNNYLLNCKYIENKINDTITQHKKLYCKYISKYNNTYDNFINICDQDKYSSCSELSADHKKYIPQELYKKLKCNDIKEAEAEAQTDKENTSDDSNSNPLGNSSSEFNSFNIFPIFFSIFGTFLVSFIVYKLTPVGSFLNKRIIKNNKIEEHFNNVMNSISLEDTSEIVDINFDESPINITYQQA